MVLRQSPDFILFLEHNFTVEGNDNNRNVSIGTSISLNSHSIFPIVRIIIFALREQILRRCRVKSCLFFDTKKIRE